MIKNTLYEPLLFANVIFYIGDGKEIEKEYNVDLNLLVGSVFSTDRMVKDIKFRDYIVWIESPVKFYDLMHETIHLVKQVFVDRKIPINEFNDEIFAYYHGYFFKKMWKICGKYLTEDGKLKENWGKLKVKKQNVKNNKKNNVKN